MIQIFYFDKKLKQAKVKDLPKLKNKKIWIDVTDITKEEAEILKKKFDLHPVTAEDLLNIITRIKVEEFPEYLFCIFYGIEKNKDMIEIDFVLGENFIISNHRKPIPSIEDLKSSGNKIENLMNKGLDFVFHKLIDTEIDNFFPVMEKIDDQIESMEEEVTKTPKPEILSKILRLKRSLIQIKKITFPQREKIGQLAKNDYRFISKKSLPYFRDVYDHSIRVSDFIDNYREAVGNTFDVYMSAVSNNMNEVMKTLSIIATIALPLTVISGIYGTNFANLPGQHFYYGFWIMILAMIILSLSMIFYFKRRGWF
jgi:magnesium transporter